MFCIAFLNVILIAISVIYCEPIKARETVDCAATCPVKIDTDSGAVSFKYELGTCSQCATDCPVDISVTKDCDVSFKYNHDVVNPGQCVCADESWTLGPDKQCLKLLDTTPHTNYDARQKCSETFQAKLMTIKSAEKQQFVQDYVNKESITANIWLDAIRIGAENVNSSFIWSDGTLMSYANWADNGFTVQDGQYCAIFDSASASDQYTWHVFHCTLDHSANFNVNAVCERPCTVK